MMAQKYDPIQHAPILIWINSTRSNGRGSSRRRLELPSYNNDRINGSEAMARADRLMKRMPDGGLPGDGPVAERAV